MSTAATNKAGRSWAALPSCSARRMVRRSPSVAAGEPEEGQAGDRLVAGMVRPPAGGLGLVEGAPQAVELALLIVGPPRAGSGGSASSRQAASAVAAASVQSPAACCNWARWTRHWPR